MRRRRYSLARQVSMFPVLILVDEDDDTGRITFYPLPIELQWQLTVKWLWLTVIGLAQLTWDQILKICWQAAKEFKAHWLRRPWLPQPTLLRRAVGIGQWFRQSRWGVRLNLEIRMAVILGRQLGLAGMGR